MEYKDMVQYVNGQMGLVLDAVRGLSDQMTAHEQYHRTLLESALKGKRDDKWTRRGYRAAILTALASSTGFVTLLAQHVRFR